MSTLREPAELEQLLSAVQGICHSPISSGNSVIVLENGPNTYPAMLQDIAAAKYTINFENFIIESDTIGWKFANALAERASTGVSVNLLYDALGSQSTSDDYWEFLRGAGVNVQAFHPLDQDPDKLQIRDHRKIITVDGRIGYIGGHCIGDEWAGHDEDQPAWRDTHCRIEGPAVLDLQRTFCECWHEAGGGGCESHDQHYFPDIEPAGSFKIMTLTCGTERTLKQVYSQLLDSASQRIMVMNAYFHPDETILEAFKQAAGRGVKVQLIMPSKSDVDIMVTAARSLYSELLEAGVEIYEYQPAVVHAKTAIIDGCLSMIGSCNLDYRSLHFNYEANVAILGADFATQQEATFAKDLEQSVKIELAAWQQRSLLEKFKEQMVRLTGSQL